MKKNLIVLFMAIVLLLGMGANLQASDHSREDPLIKILIRKGILTQKEAEEIKKEAAGLEKQRKKEIVKEVQDKNLSLPKLPKALKGLKIGGLAYIDYSNGQSAETQGRRSSFNRFSLTRGYLTVKKQILPWMQARITTDIHRDSSGDYTTRIKYLYAELSPPNLGPFTEMKAEIGQGHIPWLDFEEAVNTDRCQGKMPIERAGVFNSADTGVSLHGNFGGRLRDALERTGDPHYDGRYGTWFFGVYNGSGYHNKEINNNKVLEGRITLRPLPDLIPGLQFSYFGLHGEGNRRASNGDFPGYTVNLGMLSYEHPWLIFTAQYFQTTGNAQGTWVDARGNALETDGYSFFGSVRLPVFDRKFSLFTRYDHFDQDNDKKIARDANYNMYIGGLAWNVYKGNKLLLVYEKTDYGENAGKKGKIPVVGNRLGDDHRIQAVWQVKF